MVTPPDTNGRLFNDYSPFAYSFDMFPVEPVGTSGGFLFETAGSSLRTPEGGNGRVEGDIWEAERGITGWQVVRHVDPTGVELVAPEPGGISADHSYEFVFAARYPPRVGTNGSLAAEGEGGYLGDRDGNYELTGVGSLGVERLARGRYISPGGEHVIFSTGHSEEEGNSWCNRYHNPPKYKCLVARLEPEAPSSGTGAIYDRQADGPTRVVSLLPGNVTPLAGENAIYQGTSTDATSIAFKIGGALYVRADNGTEGAKTEEVISTPVTFGGISTEGTYLYYVAAGNIHRFNVNSEEDEEVNSSGDAEMVNVSADGSHLYFISPSQLDGSKGSAGEPNLYVWSGNASEYVATVDPKDVANTGEIALTNWTGEVVATSTQSTRGPGRASSRTTPDGSVIVFESRAQLTPYDNAGHNEIYRYDDVEKSLRCVSCNPEGTAATADARLEKLPTLEPSTLIHNLTADGGRVFFETSEALLEGDLNSTNDIYEWQEVGGAPTLSLISPGDSIEYLRVVEGSPDPNLLLGISADGSEVFFRSLEPLVPGAGIGGAPAIYDARVDGGFPPAPPPAQPCQGMVECRGEPGRAPALEGARSQGPSGEGNVKPGKHRRCTHKEGHRKARGRRGCQGKKAAGHGRSASAGTSRSSQSILVTDSIPAGLPDPLPQSQPGGAGAGSVAALAAEFEGFGIESVAAAASVMNAAEHPDFSIDVSFAPRPATETSARLEDLVTELPPGLLGNPNVLPRCRTGDLLGGECPVDSQVGVTRALLKGRPGFETFPLFNLAPVHPEEEVARLGLMTVNFPVFIDVSVRTAGDYGATVSAKSLNGIEPVEAVEATVWGNPADHSHDKLRMTILEGTECSGTPCKVGGERESGIKDPKPFMTNPSACQPMKVDFSATSYQIPGQVFTASAPMDSITSCRGLPFAPAFKATPTSDVAGGPTGLETTLRLPQVEEIGKPGTATIREARVTLPEGMSIAAGTADGIEACSEDQVGFHREVDAACPNASKLGTATITSPALAEPLQGAIYQRTPRAGHPFGFWLVTDALGLHVKIPAEIEPNHSTGQLTTVFRDLPQVPTEEISVDVFGGPRAPLKNPDECGTYLTSYTFAPHSEDAAVSGQSQMTIDEGCSQGFSPKLDGGATNPIAGAFSPFVIDLTREDGEQSLRGFELTLPPGELAKIKGVGLCPDAAAASGSCPADSKIGHLVAAAGPGPNPLWAPQPGKAQPSIHLAGPYQGAPFSIVTEVPAQAGPFDLGNVVVRSALQVDPETALATVKADPLPQFFEGVGLAYRRLHAVADRPGFMLNPTNCSELAVKARVTSNRGTVATPSLRFQVDDCKALKFKPKLTLTLSGGTKRGDYPALKAVLRPRKGDANVSSVSTALPHSEFVAQEHIVTVCTRVQFAAHKCPKGSVYGMAKAWSPLLPQPLAGPVYLRSSSNPLPDLVMDLGGELEVAVAGRIDSVNGGIRPSFDAVPDAPISKFVLKMKGGKKGLLVNSTDICRRAHMATVKMGAQNGRVANLRPKLVVSGCGT